MKIGIYTSILMLSMASFGLAHQPEEQLFHSFRENVVGQKVNAHNVGAFEFYESLKPKDLQSVELSYQKDVESGEDSNVLLVNGNNEFYKAVIQGSRDKLVVVVVVAENSQDSVKARPVFQKVAASMNGKVSFVAMDLFDRIGDSPENYQLIVKLMLLVGVTRLALPTYLFFRNGRLLKKASIEPGFLPESHLRDVIQKRLSVVG